MRALRLARIAKPNRASRRQESGEVSCGGAVMRLGPVPASRKRAVPSLAVVVVLGVASVGYPFGRTWFTGTAATGGQAARDEEKAKAKPSHPPITGLRDRMLANFHGQTPNRFTALPGFGNERLPPLYKSIPFEIPDLSTNEVEIEKQIVPPEVLKDVFAWSLDGFRDPAKPLPPGKKE